MGTKLRCGVDTWPPVADLRALTPEIPPEDPMDQLGRQALEMANITSTIYIHQLRWTSHLVRTTALPTTAMTSGPASQKKHWKDNIRPKPQQVPHQDHHLGARGTVPSNMEIHCSQRSHSLQERRPSPIPPPVPLIHVHSAVKPGLSICHPKTHRKEPSGGQPYIPQLK